MNSTVQIQQEEIVNLKANKEMYLRVMAVAELLLKAVNAQNATTLSPEASEKTQD